MRAAVCRAYGGPDEVTVEEVPDPEPAAGQVRVRVRAAAVNFPDVLLVADRYQITVPPPFVPGSEFAGVVEEVADGAEGMSVGDRVAGTVLVAAVLPLAVAAVGRTAGASDASPGTYTVTLNPGHYDIVVEATGFENFRATQVVAEQQFVQRRFRQPRARFLQGNLALRSIFRTRRHLAGQNASDSIVTVFFAIIINQREARIAQLVEIP